MTGPLARRLVPIERQRDVLVQWAGVPAAQCPDAVLVAMVARQADWPPSYCPSDAELAAVITPAAGTANTDTP